MIKVTVNECNIVHFSDLGACFFPRNLCYQVEKWFCFNGRTCIVPWKYCGRGTQGIINFEEKFAFFLDPCDFETCIMTIVRN